MPLLNFSDARHYLTVFLLRIFFLHPFVIRLDVILHPDLPPADAVAFGFAVGFGGGPAFVKHPVDGDDRAGAVGAAFAVNKHGMMFGIHDDFDYFVNFVVFGGKPVAQVKIDKLQAVFFRRLLFAADVFAGVAEIDDGFDAERGKPPDAFGGGLSAAVEIFVDAVKIRQMFVFRFLVGSLSHLLTGFILNLFKIARNFFR
jgi:hypothetical protein